MAPARSAILAARPAGAAESELQVAMNALEAQDDLFSEENVLGFTRLLLADLHDDLWGKVSRFRQMADLSKSLGPGGTFMPGGEVAYTAWVEARSSFVQGNFIATVLLCQSMAEHLLAAHVTLSLDAPALPRRVSFRETLQRCVATRVFDDAFSIELARMMDIRNPLSHYRDMDDPSNLTRRMLNTRESVLEHLRSDASYALTTATKLLSMPPFYLSGERLQPLE